MSNEEQNNKMVLISVSFDCDKNIYTVDLAKGSNVAETAFAIKKLNFIANLFISPSFLNSKNTLL